MALGWAMTMSQWSLLGQTKDGAEAKKAVFEYIELFYNRRRTHSTNGYIPPFMFGQAS